MEVVQLIPRDTCSVENDYDGQLWGARISAIFVVLVASTFGSVFPILSSKYSFIRLPPSCFFVAKYFGSGVIIATSMIHMLQPANENLSADCLGEQFHIYPWAFAICLLTIFLLFLFELLAFKFIEAKTGDTHVHSHFGDEELLVRSGEDKLEKKDEENDDESSHAHLHEHSHAPVPQMPSHFSHAKDHQNMEVVGTLAQDPDKEAYYGQLLSVFVLEFGVIFHSVFIGLTLAVSGNEFKTLYIVVVFHQLFEGLGLGTRIATTPWARGDRMTPWFLAGGYLITTPIAIAIGLGVRTSYLPGSRTSLITNGVFDSVSAGILLYTGLIELMAHEFLYGDEFKGEGGLKKMLLAYFTMCWGCGLMALLGRWA